MRFSYLKKEISNILPDRWMTTIKTTLTKILIILVLFVNKWFEMTICFKSCKIVYQTLNLKKVKNEYLTNNIFNFLN